ncbi:hypothetical protein XELAEV_18039808mg [Xenopus laevis]|uniref:Uncharacterized protein n=1 Tax=Xenopus laevis TaxID=8355 RepID=A0A974H8P8_XENLA|nr:hypothetical protein XELAEV_18039808mg [Xenopus laevis]
MICARTQHVALSDIATKALPHIQKNNSKCCHFPQRQTNIHRIILPAVVSSHCAWYELVKRLRISHSARVLHTIFGLWQYNGSSSLNQRISTTKSIM